jgi:hypothetical protein
MAAVERMQSFQGLPPDNLRIVAVYNKYLYLSLLCFLTLILTIT